MFVLSAIFAADTQTTRKNQSSSHLTSKLSSHRKQSCKSGAWITSGRSLETPLTVCNDKGHCLYCHRANHLLQPHSNPYTLPSFVKCGIFLGDDNITPPAFLPPAISASMRWVVCTISTNALWGSCKIHHRMARAILDSNPIRKTARELS